MSLLARLAVRLALRDLEGRTPGPYVMARHDVFAAIKEVRRERG